MSLPACSYCGRSLGEPCEAECYRDHYRFTTELGALLLEQDKDQPGNCSVCGDPILHPVASQTMHPRCASGSALWWIDPSSGLKCIATDRGVVRVIPSRRYSEFLSEPVAA